MSKKINQDNQKPEKRNRQPGDPNDQDIKRRLGNFTGAGEAPRQGGRHGMADSSQKNSSRKGRKKGTK